MAGREGGGGGGGGGTSHPSPRLALPPHWRWEEQEEEEEDGKEEAEDEGEPPHPPPLIAPPPHSNVPSTRMAAQPGVSSHAASRMRCKAESIFAASPTCTDTHVTRKSEHTWHTLPHSSPISLAALSFRDSQPRLEAGRPAGRAAAPGCCARRGPAQHAPRRRAAAMVTDD